MTSDAVGNRFIARQSVDRTSRGQVSRGVLGRRFSAIGVALPTPVATATALPPVRHTADDGCTLMPAAASSHGLWLAFPPVLIIVKRMRS